MVVPSSQEVDLTRPKIARRLQLVRKTRRHSSRARKPWP
jgi:hypothetical protein